MQGRGQFNLKGKKTKLLGCGCCVCYDFRDKILKSLHKKEIRDAESRSDELENSK